MDLILIFVSILQMFNSQIKRVFKNNDIQSIKNLLIENSSLIHFKDASDWNLLHYAIHYFKKNEDLLFEITNYLLSLGISINDKTFNGNTVIHASIILKMSVPFIKHLLLSEDYNIDERNNELKTILHLSLENNYKIDLIQLIITKGANINAKAECDLTPLYYAIRMNRNIKIIKYLINNGADVQFYDEMMGTLIHVAIDNTKMNHRYQILKILIQSQQFSNLNKINIPFRETSLHLLCLQLFCTKPITKNEKVWKF